MKFRIETIGARLDLNLLVVFDAIYRARNLTAAGQVLGLSQPAMSHALGRLRSMLKDPLFVRLPRGLQPTPFANDIAPALIEGLGTIRGGLERRVFDPATSTRIFNLGMGDIAEVVHLPRLSQEMRVSAPHIGLHTMEVAGPRLRDALAEGVIDLAVGDYELGAGCRHVTLYESEYACVLRKDHPDIGTRLTLKQFRAAQHVLVSPKGAFPHGQHIERTLTSRKINARIVLQVSHFHPVLALVSSSDLIATVPARLAATMKQAGNVKVLPPPVSLPRITVSLYWHDRFHREPGNIWVRNLYMNVVGQ